MEEIGELIRSCGFYNTKSKDILGMCLMIRDQFGGRVPDTIEELTQLPGVGRKTANLILGDIYHKPAVVTDTHCIRITGRLGLTKNTAPGKGGTGPAGRAAPRGIQRLLPPVGTSRQGGVHRPEGRVRQVLHGVLLQKGRRGPQRGEAGQKGGDEKSRDKMTPAALDLNPGLRYILIR